MSQEIVNTTVLNMAGNINMCSINDTVALQNQLDRLFISPVTLNRIEI